MHFWNGKNTILIGIKASAQIVFIFQITKILYTRPSEATEGIQTLSLSANGS